MSYSARQLGLRFVLSLVASAALVACDKPAVMNDAHVEPLPPPSAPAPAEAEPVTTLDGDGLVCWSRGKTWIWRGDNGSEKVDMSLVQAEDGSLYRRVKGKELHSLADPKAPPLSIPASLSRPLIVANGVVELDAKASAVKLHREGQVSTYSLPDGVTVKSSQSAGAAWMGDTLWFAARPGLFRSHGNVLERVDIGGNGAEVAGFAQTREGALVVTFDVQKRADAYVVWKLDPNGEAVEHARVPNPKRFTSRLDMAVGKSGRLGLYNRAMRADPVFTVSAKGKVEELARGGAILTIDDQDRVWYRSRGEVIAWEGAEKQANYPIASSPAFGVVDGTFGGHCAPVGKGLETLPAAGEARTGILSLSVIGPKGKNAPFVACESANTRARCKNDKRKVEGTFDASGRWSGPAPVGRYYVAIQAPGGWMTTNFTQGAKHSCVVEKGKTCTLSMVTN